MNSPCILYEDNHLLVLVKPGAMPTVPDRTGDLSLLDWARDYIKQSRSKPGRAFVAVVHRLDRPVSGIVCFALTSKAASRLSDQLRCHTFDKEYVAVVTGDIAASGTLRHWLFKDRRKNQVFLYPPDTTPPDGAKMACTKWRLLGREKDYSLVTLVPVTGRPHQLHAQLASIGAPITGDIKYGPGPCLREGVICLHAYRLSFAHPTKRNSISFTSGVPGYFHRYFDKQLFDKLL